MIWRQYNKIAPNVIQYQYNQTKTDGLQVSFTHVPVPLLTSYQRIIPSPRPLWIVRNIIRFYGEESSNPQVGVAPLVVCPRLLIQYIHSLIPYWRPFLQPQLEDAPCRGDRDPLIMVTDLVFYQYNHLTTNILQILYLWLG